MELNDELNPNPELVLIRMEYTPVKRIIAEIIDENNDESDEDKIIESIDIWGTISYKGLIPPELIINEDFDYLS